jgi:hypothetical protein
MFVGKATGMKIKMIVTLSIATAATALPLAAIAHADNNYQQFASRRETSGAY